MNDEQQNAQFSIPKAGAEGRVGLEEALAQTPAAVRNYLLSPEIGETRQGIYKDHDLNEEEQEALLYTELQTFFGDIGLDDFPDVLWSRLTWPDDQEERARKLALDVLGRILLPAQAYLGDVASVITSLGGNLDRYPTEGIEPRTVTLNELTDAILSGIGVTWSDPVRRRRLSHLIETRIKGVRDYEESVQQMMKSRKTGGLDMEREEAEKVVDLIDLERQLTRVVDSQGTELVPAMASVEKYSPQTIQQSYLGSEESQQALAEAFKEAIDFAGQDGAKLTQWLIDQMEPAGGNMLPDKWRVAAGFLAASNFGGIPEAMTESSEIRGLVLRYAEEKELSGILEIWDEDPTAPEIINILGQLILRGYAGLDDHDSARLMLRAANAMAKRGEDRYKRLAYFNTENGKFSWSNPIEIVGA